MKFVVKVLAIKCFPGNWGAGIPESGPIGDDRPVSNLAASSGAHEAPEDKASSEEAVSDTND